MTHDEVLAMVRDARHTRTLKIAQRKALALFKRANVPTTASPVTVDQYLSPRQSERYQTIKVNYKKTYDRIERRYSNHISTHAPDVNPIGTF